MATRFLDLDPVRQPVGEVRIDGQTYQVWPITLGTVINLSAPGPADDNGTSFGQQMEQSMGVLRELIPDLAEATLRGLPLEAFNRLLAWARETAFGAVEKNSEPPVANPIPPVAETPATAPSTSPA